MGNTHIKGWQMFLIAGFLAGAISGILLVANQRGKVAKIKATDTPPEFAGFVPWRLIGPGGGGRITSVTEDPSDSKNLYMTINVGGARKSTDGGKTWRIINRGFDYATKGDNAQRMADIAVHPKNSNVVLAAGLGGDLYYSRDGGTTWIFSKRLPEDNDFSRFTFDPINPDVVYVAVGSIQKLILGVDAIRQTAFWPSITKSPTILRGTWTGSAWVWNEIGALQDPENPPRRDGGVYLNIYSIGINPADTKELFFVTERGLYKGRLNSGNTMTSFTRITTGLPSAKAFQGGKIVFDTVNKNIAYLTAMNLGLEEESRTRGGVFKSIDGGNTWAKLVVGLDAANSNYFDIQIDPKDSRVIYVAQFYNDVTKAEGSLYRSQNAGGSWTKIIDWARVNPGWGGDYLQPGFVEKPGPDFVSVSRFGPVIRIANSGGHLIENETAAEPYTWKNILTKKVGTDEWTTTGSEAIAVAFSIGIDPKNSNVVYLPYGDHVYFKSENGGNSVFPLSYFEEMRQAGNAGDSGTLVVDEQESNKVYVATRGPHQKLEDGGVMYSHDGGKMWQVIGGKKGGGLANKRGLDRAAMTDLLVEYKGSRRNLYVASYGNKDEGARGGLYMFEDTESNNDWKPLLKKDNAHSITSRNNFNDIYVGVDREGVYRVGRNVATREGNVSGPIDLGGSKIFYDMETSPSGVIFAATDKGLFTIDKNDAVARVHIPQIRDLSGFQSAVEIFPKDERIIYFATSHSELLRSQDGGASWHEISKDIPTLGFQILKADPNEDTIYVESAGGGIWKKSFKRVVPAPVLSSIDPSFVTAGRSAIFMLRGERFTQGAVIHFKTPMREEESPATFISPQELQWPASFTSSEKGAALIYVKNPDGQISPEVQLTILAPLAPSTNLKMEPDRVTKSFRLSWTRPEEDNTGARGYFIEVGKDCSPWNGEGEPICQGGWSHWYDTVTFGLTQFTLSHLPDRDGDVTYTDGEPIQSGTRYCADVYAYRASQDIGPDVYACGKLEQQRISPPR